MFKTIIVCLSLVFCQAVQAQDLSPEATCNHLIELIKSAQVDGSLKETEENIQYLGTDYPVYSLSVYNHDIKILGENLSKAYNLYSKNVFSEVKQDVQLAGLYYPGVFAKKGRLLLKIGLLMYLFKNVVGSSEMLTASPLGEINYLLLGRIGIVIGAIFILLDMAIDKNIVCNPSKPAMLSEHPSMIIHEALNHQTTLVYHMKNDEKVLHAVYALETTLSFAQVISTKN